MITQKQFEAIKAYFQKDLYYSLGHDVSYKIYCHIPNKLVSFSHYNVGYGTEYIPYVDSNREFTFFNENGEVVPTPNTLPEIFCEIPFSTKGGEVDDKSILAAFTPSFMDSGSISSEANPAKKEHTQSPRLFMQYGYKYNQHPGHTITLISNPTKDKCCFTSELYGDVLFDRSSEELLYSTKELNDDYVRFLKLGVKIWKKEYASY